MEPIRLSTFDSNQSAMQMSSLSQQVEQISYNRQPSLVAPVLDLIDQ